jgi:CheY-like chemotaxis protein
LGTDAAVQLVTKFMCATQKRRVLLVDDNDAVRKAYAIILKALGWDVSNACHAEEAYKIASKENFDLAILDVTMPGMNGIEFCGELKTKLPNAVGKIIVVSGVIDRPTSETALAAGAEHFLQKPIGYSQLKETLASMGLS